MAADDEHRGAEDARPERAGPLWSRRATRLRWRMRGAWMWPAFVALTLVDAVVLRELPFYETAPGDLYGTLLIAGVVNLAAVALVAPPTAWLLRRRRPDLPREVARNYAGTALLAVITAGLVAGGIAHRPAVREEERDLAAQSAAVRAYVTAQAPEYRRGLHAADPLRLTEDLYRTCVPGTDPRRPLCVFVSTDQRPAGVRRDPDRSPNSAYRAHRGLE